MENLAYKSYHNTHLGTASPARLTLMLYDGFLSCLTKAQHNIAENKPEPAHKKLIKAQDILAELMSSLNLDLGEIPQNLLGLYEFVMNLVIMGNVQKDPAFLRQATSVIQPIRDAWEQAVVLVTPVDKDETFAPAVNE